MKAAKIEQEQVRLAMLRGYNILDTAPEADFDEIVKLASEICDTPVALVSLVEEDRQWFKSSVGLTATQTPIEQSICAHAILADDFLEIEDTKADARTMDNPLVTGDDNMQFYAGALLEGDDGLSLGTLCVIDHKPRKLTDFQVRALKVLANQVMRQIELRKALAASEILGKEVDHRVKNSLQSLEALIRIQIRGEKSQDARAALEAVQGRLAMVSSLHEALYMADAGAYVGLRMFVEKVVHAAAGQMPAGVKVHVKLAECDLESRDASSVGMIVNEAMVNAAKYAFVGREAGNFHVTGTLSNGTYQLVLADDGVGGSAGSADGTGLGRKIMDAATQQLGGTLDTAQSDAGYKLTLSWPDATQ